MGEFQPTEEFFKEEIKKYDSDIIAAGQEADEAFAACQRGEISKEEKDRREDVARAKAANLKHQKLDMLKQLTDAEAEITSLIDSAIQDAIAMAEESNEIEQMMAEEEERKPVFFPVSLKSALEDAFYYDEDTFPKSEMNDRILATLKDKYKDVLDKMPEEEGKE